MPTIPALAGCAADARLVKTLFSWVALILGALPYASEEPPRSPIFFGSEEKSRPD
jgi:hypothetical protein